MSYTDQEKPAVWKKVAGIGGAIFAFFIAKAIVGGGMAFFTGPTKYTETSFSEAVQNDENFGQMFSSMETKFPNEYSKFTSEMIGLIDRGRSEDEAFHAGRAWMQRFLLRSRRQFQAAPKAELLRARDASIASIEALAVESDTYCAHFAVDGLQSNDRPSKPTMNLLSTAAVAQIDAIYAGKHNPVVRGPATDQDYEKFVEQLRV